MEKKPSSRKKSFLWIKNMKIVKKKIPYKVDWKHRDTTCEKFQDLKLRRGPDWDKRD